MITTGSFASPAALRSRSASAFAVVKVNTVLSSTYRPCESTPTLISRGRCFAASASASGSVICSSEIRWYVVVTIRKIRITSSTSINGMKLISGSSRERVPRRFMPCPRSRSAALAVREVDQLDRLLLHFDDQRVNFRAEMAVENHARNGDDQAHGRVVQGDRNALRELNRIGACRGLRAENFDHADDRAEKPQQRRHRGD